AVLADPFPSGRPDLGAVDAAAGRPAAEPTPGGQAEPVIEADIDELPAGAPAAAPWYADGAIHDGETVVPFDAEFAGLRSLSAVAGGYAVLTADSEGVDGNELWLVPSGGEQTRLARGAVYSMAVSADGALVAWAEHDWSTRAPGDGPGRTVVYVADATTGEILHEREQTGDDGPVGSVRGFLGPQRVVLDSATNAPTGVYVWDLAADTVTPWTDFGFTAAVSPTGELAALVPPNEAADRTTAVVDGVTGEIRWRAPERATITSDGFSPDGRYVTEVVEIGPSPEDVEASALAEGIVIADAATGEPVRTVGSLQQGAHAWEVDYAYEIVVADTATGEPVRTIRGLRPMAHAWEPDGSLLIEAWEDDERAALVRCTVGGGCELAAPVRDSAGGRPYDLGASG
ncbi:hypothetical protein DY240_12095, partial [Jiangella rhizosphaerae]